MNLKERKELAIREAMKLEGLWDILSGTEKTAFFRRAFNYGWKARKAVNDWEREITKAR